MLGLFVSIIDLKGGDLVGPWFTIDEILALRVLFAANAALVLGLIVNPGTPNSSPDVVGVSARIIMSWICSSFTSFVIPAPPFIVVASVDDNPPANEGPKAVEGVTGESVGRVGGGLSFSSSFCFFLLAAKSFSESFTLAEGGGGGVGALGGGGVGDFSFSCGVGSLTDSGCVS
jgi:hypothetical protein